MAGIQDAINQAKEAAEGMVANDAVNASTAVIQGSVSPGGVATTYQKPSMATVAAATGVIPRNTPYLKVNEFGMRVGKNKDFIDDIPVEIALVEDEGFMVKYTLRFGNPAQYLSSYDGMVCDKGGSWNDALVKARMADPNVEPYNAVDIVVRTTAPLKLKEETLPAGTVIGLNTSKSNFSEWSDFYAECAKAGLIGQTVKVKLGCREINHGGNTWGVVTFTLAE
jgi:hypothetical protein